MSNLIKRTVPVILVLIVCITCLVFPAAASSFEVPESFFNVLDYSTPNSYSSCAVSLPDSYGTVSFDIPGDLLFNSVDLVISSTSDLTHVYINDQRMKVLEISDGVYRVYGSLPDVSFPEFFVDLYCSGKSVVTFLTFHAFNDELSQRPVKGELKINYDNSIVYDQAQSSVGESLSYTYPIEDDNNLYATNLYLSCGAWRYNDFIAFRFRSNMTVNNIVAMTEDGDYVLPCSISYHSDVAPTNDSTLYYCIIDLRSLPKTIPEDNNPILYVRGYRQGSRACSAQLYDVTGFVSFDYVDPNLNFLRKFQSLISNKFDALIDEFKKITGSGADSDAISAQQKQEELNVSINNQLVGAVEDWNTNIEIVETGYDMAIANVSSPLVWLASLADGVFNGMGWFGNIYFLIGLISVIMLVLSKSGLARSIGRFRRE